MDLRDLLLRGGRGGGGKGMGKGRAKEGEGGERKEGVREGVVEM